MLAQIERAICGLAALLTYCDSWLALSIFGPLIHWRIFWNSARVSQNVNACRRLASLLALRRYAARPLPRSLSFARDLGAGCGILPPVLPASCLGSLRVVFGFLPTDAATFTTPGLRSV